MPVPRISEEQRYRKTSATGFGASPVIVSDVNPIIDAVNALSGNVTPPRKYVAILNQSGTNAPVATILENTLGFVPVWSYTSTGIYHLTYAGGFPTEAKVAFFIISTAWNHQVGIYWNSVNDIECYTATFAGVYANTKLDDNTVEIRIYE